MWTDPLVRAMAISTAAVMLGHPFPAQEAGSSRIDDSEMYAVYASLLPDEWTVRVAGAKILVFQQETVTYPQCMPSGETLDTDWRPVVESYKSANIGVHIVLGDQALHYAYVVLPAAEIQASFKDVANDPMVGWTGFYRRHPDSGGYMQVSAVGFDASKTRAMVYMAHRCGSLCGGGTHHFVEKVDGAWRAAKIPGVRHCSWAS
jgi:hypothetical protein